MYQNCLKKFYNNNDSNILLFLARAYFEAGMIEECEKSLIKAIHIKPQNLVLWFNLALAQEAFAIRAIQKEKRTADEIQKATIELTQAIKTFSNLAENKTANRNYSTTKATEHLKNCKKNWVKQKNNLIK